MSSVDPIRECRDKCQPIRNISGERSDEPYNPAMYFWLSKDKKECTCLPGTPLGGNFVNLHKYIDSFCEVH